MNYVAEMGSGAVIYTRFHKDWLRNSEIDKGIHKHKDKTKIT